MKNKKGFTILELICVIGILIVIAGIFSLNMINSLSNSKEKEKENITSQIKSAADAYVSANPDAVKNLYQGYGYVDIPVGDLRNAGILMEDIKDPETGEIIPDDKVVRVKLNFGDYMEFIYPVENEQDAWKLIAEPLTIRHDTSISNWCNDTSKVFTGLITDPHNSSVGESRLYLENNEGKMYEGNYFGSEINLQKESCNVNVKKEGTYSITYKYIDPDLGTEKKQTRTVYVAADSADIVEFEVLSINSNNPIMQLLPESNISIVIREYLRGNATRTVTTTIGDLGNKGYRIANFSTKDIALNGKDAIISSNKVNSDGSTPASKKKTYTVVPAKYDIYFDANGGAATKSKLTVEYDKLYNTYGSFPTASRTGYNFLGWYSSPSGGIKIDATTKVTDPNIRTLYAHWEGRPYNVTYNGNGGTPTSSSSTVIFGNYYTIPTYTPTRVGYDFMGWSTSSTYGSGTSITSYTRVNTASNHTVYASWRGKPYTVYFDSNGGSPSGRRTTTQYFGSYYSLPSSPYKTGYNFDGWYTSLSGGSRVTSNTIMYTASTHTLYARYSEITYTLYYDPNGGSVSPRSKTVKYSQDRRYGTLPTPYRNGYDFLGWYTSYSGGSRVSENTYLYGDETIYAHWSPKSFTVYFNSNGGYSVSPSSKSVTYNSSYGNLPTPSKSNGAKFLGWYTSSSGGSQITYYSTVSMTSSHTLYAHWEEPKVTITFKDPYGSNTYSQEYNSGSYVRFPTWSKCAHKIHHWCKGSYTSKNMCTSGVTGGFTATSNATYTAAWTIDSSDCTARDPKCSIGWYAPYDNYIQKLIEQGKAWQDASQINDRVAMDSAHSCAVRIIQSEWGSTCERLSGKSASSCVTRNSAVPYPYYEERWACFLGGPGTWHACTSKPKNETECGQCEKIK